ncbi:MAG TPA: ATP-binding cassette domain-containing protein [Herpetosiphonaceae bacterium]
MDAVIDVRGLQKVYADGTEAVKGISFQVTRGEFFGFLGPNGAGKSTTIKMLITLLAKSGGAATILGHDISRETNQIRRLIGYAAQEVGVDDDLTARENLTLQGKLYHLPGDVLRQRVDELLALMDLTNDADRSAGSFSGGMRKRLDLATGLIHRPQVLFLDEPTTGLDPQNRANLWQYLERLNKDEGLTIFLTTHYMEEADRLCDRLAIIDHGTIIAEGSPAQLKAQLGGDVIALTFNDNGKSGEEQAQQAVELLKGLPFVRDTALAKDGINVIAQDGGAMVPQVLLALNGAGLNVGRLSLTSPTLDDVFLKYTGQSIRQEEVNTNWRSGRGGPWGGRRRRR